VSHPTAQPAPPRPHASRLDRLRGIPGVALVFVVALSITITGLLADGAAERGDLAADDPAVTTWLVHSRTPLLSGAAQLVTTIGSEPAMAILTVLVLAWLVIAKRARASAVLFAASMGTAGALSIGLKHLMARQRPPAADVLGPLDSSFSFPSGHTLFSTVFFGLVAGLLLTRTTGRTSRVLVVSGWVVASALVGVTRLYLGYHWLTDVVASWALAVAVLACAAAAWAVFRQHPVQVATAPRHGGGLDDRPVARAGS
jgi:undecaprenyl-diphosphatase